MAVAQDWITRAKVKMTEKRITQLDLVPIFGKTTRGAVGHYFTGRTKPSTDQMIALAKHLDVSLNYLLYGDDKGAGIDNDKLRLCISTISKVAKDLEMDLTDDQKAALATYLYSETKVEVETEKAIQLVKMFA